jgi:hypothetical protein
MVAMPREPPRNNSKIAKETGIINSYHIFNAGEDAQSSVI